MVDHQTKHRSVEPSEWWFVAGMIIILLAVTSIPYAYGYLSTTSDKQYMGIMLDVPDHVQYFSWMRELSDAYLASNKLTSESNQPVFFNLLWWGLGRLGKLFGWDYPIPYQIMRVVGTLCFLFLAYLFCARFFDDIWKRRIAFLIICFSSGLGWILVLLKYTLTKGELLFPLDVFIAEGNTFLCILGYPHFIAALLYILVFELVLHGERTNKLSYAVGAGLVALFLGWQHAYDLISVYAVLGAYGILKIWRDRRIPRYILISGILIVGISCWPAVYSVLLTTLDPLWKDVLAQFANAGVFTPNLLHLPILLGFAFILALIMAIRYNPIRSVPKTDLDLFITGWFWISFVIVYLPVDYQIHLLNGWQIPIAIFATKGLFEWIIPVLNQMIKVKSRFARWNFERIVPVIFLVLISLTNVYLFFWQFIDLSRHDYPYYLFTDEVIALKWLEKEGDGTDVVLSSLDTGQYVPAISGKHAFLAHWAQTVNYHEKVKLVDEFYSDEATNEMRSKLIRNYEIQYVFYGPAEKKLGNFRPAEMEFLELVFSTPLAEVYLVR